MSIHDRLYNSRKWRKRRDRQLQRHPLCARCADRGVVVAAKVAHHIERHEGDLHKFYFGELRSLCAPCHDSIEQMIESRGYHTEIGVDGWPVDKAHPVYSRA